MPMPVSNLIFYPTKTHPAYSTLLWHMLQALPRLKIPRIQRRIKTWHVSFGPSPCSIFNFFYWIGKNPNSTLARDKTMLEYINKRQPLSYKLTFEIELYSNLHSNWKNRWSIVSTHSQQKTHLKSTSLDMMFLFSKFSMIWILSIAVLQMKPFIF